MSQVRFWRAVAVVVVVSLIARAYLRAGVEAALSITIALGVGALILVVVLDERR